MKRLTRAWVRRAEAEYHVAVVAAGADPAPHDHVCFYSRAAVATYLKALLQELGRPVPRHSNPERLTNLLLPRYADLQTLRRGLRMLSQFDISILYPGRRATKRQTVSALRWATRVRTTCRAILGLGTKSPEPANPATRRANIPFMRLVPNLPTVRPSPNTGRP